MKRRAPIPKFEPAMLAIFAAANAMTASGQEPRRHHVVPRFYLDRWAEGGRVRVTDLDARTSHQVDPKNALVETDFYRVPAGTAVGTDSPMVWEAWLSKVEGDAKAVFDRLDVVGIGGLDGEELGRLAFFIAVQATRSRYHRFQARWMASAGIHEAMELDRPGAIEFHMRQGGLDPTPDEIAAAEAYWKRVVADPWQMHLEPGWEMDMAQRTAGDLTELLATRNWATYETTKPLLTSDEPVVNLHEHMGADHLTDGGYNGAPIIIFPLGPRQVLAMYRQNIPFQRTLEKPLDWRETLDLNRVIAGNAYRNAISQPSSLLAEKLRVPASKPPTQAVAGGRLEDGREIIRWRVMRRWTDEHDAPVRPVPAWWPAVLPPPPPPPRTAKEKLAEYQRWQARGRRG